MARRRHTAAEKRWLDLMNELRGLEGFEDIATRLDKVASELIKQAFELGKRAHEDDASCP